jgi:E3 ubiquitin-protein ligase MARCH5
VDEKQKGNPSTKVSCPQCNTQYIILFPHMGPVIVMLDAVDSVIYKVCPFVAAGIVVGSVYWTAVTYGAITVMQVSIEI